MLRRPLAALFAAACCLAFTADAKAVFITSNGSVEMIDPSAAGDPPLVHIKLLDDAGFVLTNQVSGSVVGGVPTVGSEIRSIAIGIVDQVLNGAFTDATLPDGTDLLFVTAIRGEIVAGPPGTALFTQGRIFALSKPALGFDNRDPDTWPTVASAFAEWDLAEVQEWLDGSPVGSAVGYPAEDVNRSGINVITPQTRGQGQFLFVEDSSAAQTAGATPGSAPGTGGDNFIRDVVDNSPPGLVKTDEGVGVEVSQTIENISATDAGTFDEGRVSATDLLVLNAFAAAAFSGVGVDLDLVAPGVQAWATGIGGAAAPVTHFNPRFTSGVSTTGDFRAILDFNAHIGHYAVPEPSSMILFGLGLGSVGLARIRRRRNERTVAA